MLNTGPLKRDVGPVMYKLNIRISDLGAHVFLHTCLLRSLRRLNSGMMSCFLVRNLQHPGPRSSVWVCGFIYTVYGLWLLR